VAGVGRRVRTLDMLASNVPVLIETTASAETRWRAGSA
jgi:hypothetical protein